MADLLVLHGLRLRGMATSDAVARRFALDVAETDETLLDEQAVGAVSWHEFGATSGWSLTDAGRAKGERLLADELDTAGEGVRHVVEETHGAFLPLNARLLDAITRWQVRPMPDDARAANLHHDGGWDAAVLADLGGLIRDVQPLVSRLAEALPRFAGYGRRLAAAFERAVEGDREWVDGVGIDSCHTVWFELHEDLIATLGLQR